MLKNLYYISQDAVLSEMDLKHLEERDLLLRLCEQAPHSQYHQKSLTVVHAGQEVRLTDISDQRRQLRDSAVFDNKEQETMLLVRGFE